MDKKERLIESQMAAFRASIEAATAEPYIPPPPEPLWRSALAVLAGLVFYAIVAAAIVGGIAFAGAVAHFGWEIAGGVGW